MGGPRRAIGGLASGRARLPPLLAAGVVRFTHYLALVLAPHNIRVNAVHPGNIDTDMLQNEAMYRLFRPGLENPTPEDAQPAFGSMHKLPVNTLDPADVSEAVLYLASDASRYVTGRQLKVDAGPCWPSPLPASPAESPADRTEVGRTMLPSRLAVCGR
jgi:Enoyl-(Acyl carrier protein) reductase